ncbi:MAG: SDR family NAD(P)-dependent oxidoreductase, partial [Betaproteobacteria bacterium]|nr:SDR family NAD(P)-dependent oxidoreductase [Betaproteobacteria bacterium]
MSRLKDLVILVTGAGRGIGGAMAQRYAAEGARVAVADIDDDNARGMVETLRGRGGTAEAFKVDVGQPVESTRLVAEVVGRFGRLDVMVNNAGVIRVQPLLELTPETWDYNNDVNARGLFFAMQDGARHMMTQAPLASGRPRG